MASMSEQRLVNQRTRRPTAKVAAAWLTGGGATVVLALLAVATESVDSSTFWGGLVAYVATGAAAYVKRSRASDQRPT